jgi:CheY-like chemotaxis protein
MFKRNVMNDAALCIVDDDDDDLTILKEMFVAEEFSSVAYYSSGSSLLLALNAQRDDSKLPYLIVTDINMPRMSGLDLLGVLKSSVRLRNIKVIMLSTADKDHYGEKCKLLGASEFLQKPNTYDQLKKLAKYLTVC